MNRLFIRHLSVSTIIFIIVACSTTMMATAAELSLPDTPLSTSATVDPNMMLFIDSSGSMLSIVEDSDEYDEDTYSYTCTGTNKLNVGSTAYIRIPTNGDAYFYYGSNNYAFGNNSGERCFDDNEVYSASLYGFSTFSGINYASAGISASYPGKFLNWYFSPTGGVFNFAGGDRKRNNTNTRMEVAQEAATSLIDELTDIRVGLSIFDTSNGVKILANIEDVDTGTTKTNLKNEIDSINASGGTAIAESMQELARYFTLGYSSSSNLIIHPEQSNEASVTLSNVFKKSPAYSSGVSTPSEVVTDWCQQNFIVAMTDGIPTNDQDDISSYLQDYDADCDVSGTCDDHDKKKTGGYNYASSGSDYADDIILAMNDIDLRPDLSNGTTAVKNNVTTYMVGFAEEFLADDPFMADMAAAGGGGPLLSAANSSELSLAFKNATDSIFAKAAAGSGAAFNSSTLSSNSVLYAASFNSSKWSGSLQAYALSSDGTVAATASWDAATKLDATTYSTRNIFTFNADSKKGAVFNRSNLSGTQLTDLQQGPKGTTDADVVSLIDYIKGDRTNEGSSPTDYRIRSSALGDIVNSTVVYVGAPEFDWPDYNGSNDVKFGASGKSYSSFASGSAASRTPMLYVGANDGMLHGFNAETGTNAGQEEMAYIPGIITSSESDKGLHYLAQYDYQHRFYVDSTPTVSDVYINGEWRTILVGGLRNGGKGIFALDITDPGDFSASNVDATLNAESLALWEFSSANDDDFGYGYSKPTIAMMENGKWAVIIGNGYNNSGDGTAKLFILFIEEGIGGNWGAGSSYIEIDTKVGSSGTPNGLSTPRAVDIDGDSVVDRIYAGDLEGNMWAFDVDDDNTSSWKVAYKSGANPEALFVAQDSDGNAQPITTAPILALNTNTVTTTSTEPNLLVFFGTGKYIEESDKNSTDVMTYYGVWDDNAGGKTRSNLEERKLITDGDARLLSGDNIDWTSDKGWYFDLLEQTSLNGNAFELGERVISNSTISSDILLFTTALPNVNNTDVCVSNSESWIVAVDLNTGKAPSYSVFDVNDDDKMDDGDTSSSYDTDNDGVDNEKVSYSSVKTDSSMIVGNTIYIDNSLYGQSEEGDIVKEDARVISNTREGRLSWEELIRP